MGYDELVRVRDEMLTPFMQKNPDLKQYHAESLPRVLEFLEKMGHE